MLMAVEITWDADRERIDRAAVTADGKIGIVCKRVGFADWEPLYLVTNAAERRELPSCFSLSDEAKAALNDLATMEESFKEQS
jgi:hypothetical protein